MIYLELFLTFLQIGAFTFGGGYAMIALLENEFVSNVLPNAFLDTLSKINWREYVANIIKILTNCLKQF